MGLIRHRRANVGILLLVTAVFGIALSSARTAQVRAAQVRCSSSLTYVPNVPDICEQLRYVRETLRLPYHDYVARANDFRQNTKPSPYNSFDWTTDGCSKTPPPANLVFNRPCQLHDFGYRNVGKGLLANTTYRTEKTRKYIDGRFKTEMYSICKDPRAFAPFGGYASCRRFAYGMWQIVRRVNPNWTEET